MLSGRPAGRLVAAIEESFDQRDEGNHADDDKLFQRQNPDPQAFEQAQFAGPRYAPINFPDRDWITALYRPGGSGMIFLRQLVESRPFFARIPDQSLILGDPGKGGFHLQATRDRKGTYAFVYFTLNDEAARIDLGRLNAKIIRAWWYDPRTGMGTLIGELAGGGQHEFRTPPQGPDWVLVLDDAAKNYPPPGLK